MNQNCSRVLFYSYFSKKDEENIVTSLQVPTSICRYLRGREAREQKEAGGIREEEVVGEGQDEGRA